MVTDPPHKRTMCAVCCWGKNLHKRRMQTESFTWIRHEELFIYEIVRILCGLSLICITKDNPDWIIVSRCFWGIPLEGKLINSMENLERTQFTSQLFASTSLKARRLAIYFCCLQLPGRLFQQMEAWKPLKGLPRKWLAITQIASCRDKTPPYSKSPPI